jgi:Family of unknown function (DUF6221)
VIDDLIAFLEARLDEDEAAAVAAAEADKRYGGRPHWSALGNIVIDAGDPDWAVADLGPCLEDASVAAHIVRHDPARVLREVEADRKLLAELEQARKFSDHMFSSPLPEGVASGEVLGERMRAATQVLTLERVVVIRAERFSDHPDYRQSAP